MGKCEASSHSITWGAISPSANSRTLLRSCCCSSVNPYSNIVSFPLSVFPIFSLNTIYSTDWSGSSCDVPLVHSSATFPHMVRRRHFLMLSIATLGGVLVYSLDRKATLLALQHKPVRV